MNATHLALFAVASIALAVTPGPTMLLALSNGISAGSRVAAYGIAGATVASALLIAAVATGLGALLAASQTLFDVLRVAGVIYLCWLGFKLWRDRPVAMRPELTAAGTPVLSPRKAFVRSASVALSNPKTVLFFTAFLPQFVDPAQEQALQYLVLGLVFVSIDALVMLAYVLAGVQAVRFLSARSLLVINRACAVAMFLLAAALALFRHSRTLGG